MGDKGENTKSTSLIGKVTHIVVHYMVPLGLSVLLIVVFFREVNLKAVWHTVQHGCNMWAIAVVMVFTLLAVGIRGIRWGIQLRGVGIARMPAGAEMSALTGAAALNIVFPRLGEVWRCIYVSHRQKCPLMTVVGTDIGDRTSDLICVFIFIIASVVIAHKALMNFLEHYEVGRVIGEVFGHVWIWASAGVVIIAIWVLLKFFGKYKWVQSLKSGLTNLWQGFVILFHMPQLGLYLWLTLFLWIATYMSTYAGLYALDFTREWIQAPDMHYGLIVGFVMLLFGVMSTAVPSNGGLGPWTIAIAYALEIFGLPKEQAVSFALVIWAAQSIAYIIGGALAGLYIMHHRQAQ